MAPSRDQVSSFLLTQYAGGSRRQCRYLWQKEKLVPLPAPDWRPLPPSTPIDQVTLEVAYVGGARLEVEIEGSEFEVLSRSGRLIKLMNKIGQGHTPGEALKRQLSHAMGLAPLPKLKKSQQRAFNR